MRLKAAREWQRWREWKRTASLAANAAKRDPQAWSDTKATVTRLLTELNELVAWTEGDPDTRLKVSSQLRAYLWQHAEELKDASAVELLQRLDRELPDLQGSSPRRRA
jgi:hypothetical protein